MKWLIREGQNQYKANLHCHTVLSDGKWTPEQVKEEYKKRGYSVVAITDHERLIDHSDLNDENILFLTAYEAYIRDVPVDYIYSSQIHLNLYSKTPKNKMVYYTPNITKYIPEEEKKTLQYHYYVENRSRDVAFIKKMIADAKACGYIVCHNHPTWSFENEAAAEGYDECFAMEVYNHSCYQVGFFEYNQHYYDYQTSRGLTMGMIAADDNHDKHPADSPYNDSFGGVTYILADKLEYDSIISAMENKEFYASTGPRIFALSNENGVLNVKTSEAERIIFVTNGRHRKTEIAQNGESVTTSQFEMADKDTWVRVEVVDHSGHRAFTRAYRKKEIFG